MERFVTDIVDFDTNVENHSEETKNRNIFSYLDDLTVNDIPIENQSNLNGYSQFLLNRYLSMYPPTCEVALLATCAKNLTDADHYRFLYSSLPKRKLYIKWLNKKSNSYDYTVINAISTVMNCGFREANMMCQLLSEEKLNKIVEVYKEMTKLQNM